MFICFLRPSLCMQEALLETARNICPSSSKPTISETPVLEVVQALQTHFPIATPKPEDAWKQILHTPCWQTEVVACKDLKSCFDQCPQAEFTSEAGENFQHRGATTSQGAIEPLIHVYIGHITFRPRPVCHLPF